MKTTSFLISKQLAEAGFKSEHGFSWFKNESGKKLMDYGRHGTVTFEDSEERTLDYYEYCFPAYDLETILESFPETVAYFHKYCKGQFTIDLVTIGLSEDKQQNESLADTAAKLWLKLKKEGLV